MINFGLVFTIEENNTINTASRIRQSIEGIGSATDNLERSASRAWGNYRRGMDMVSLGSGLLSPLIKASEVAAKFSDLMADVAKTTQLPTQEVEKMSKAFQGMDTRTSLGGLFDIAKVGGQMGVGQLNEKIIKQGGQAAIEEYARVQTELLSFTDSINQANVALGDGIKGGPEAVAKSLGIIRGLYGETKGMDFGLSMTKIGSALNELDAAGQASLPYLSEFTNRMGQMQGLVKLTLPQVMGLGAVLEEAGVRRDIAASGLSNLFSVAGANLDKFSTFVGRSRQEMTALYDQNPNEFLSVFAQRFKGMDASVMTQSLKHLGLNSLETKKVLSSLADQTQKVYDKQTLAALAFDEGSSLAKEYAIKNSTLASMYDRLNNSIEIFYLNLNNSNIGVPILGFLNKMVRMASDFIQTDFGKNVAQVVALAGAGIASLGGLMALNSGFQYLTTSLRIFGITAMQSLAPMLPYIAGFAVIGSVIYGLRESFTAFTGVLSGNAKIAEGWYGQFQRLGGLLYAVGEAWNSFDLSKGTISFSGESFDVFKKMGIADLVVDIGWSVARIKSFFIGMIEGFKDVYNTFSGIGKSIQNAISSAFSSLGLQDTRIARMIGNLESWVQTGKYVAYFVSGVLVVAFGALAVSVIAATWPFIALGAAVAGLVYLIYNWDSVVKTVTTSVYNSFVYLRDNWQQILIGFGESVAWFAGYAIGAFGSLASWALENVPTGIGYAFGLAFEAIGWYFTSYVPWAIGKIGEFLSWTIENVPKAFNWIVDSVKSFWNNLPEFFLSLGTSLMNSLWKGMQAGWEQVQTGFNNMIAQLPGADYLGFEMQTQTSPTSKNAGGTLFGSAYADKLANLITDRNVAMASPTANMGGTTNFNPQILVQPANIILDGKVLAKSVAEQFKVEQNRR